MFALCPPDFHRIGNECYYISTYKANWLDAHFECKDRHSKLAEPLKYEDKRIRKYLLQHDNGIVFLNGFWNIINLFFSTERTDKWIGATYNWETHRWQWGYSGRNLQYQAFSQMNPK